MEKFKTPDELLEFVLTRCSNIDFYTRLDYPSKNKDVLDIFQNNTIYWDRVVYAIESIKTEFDIDLYELVLNGKDFDFGDVSFENTTIKCIRFDDLFDIPKLPRLPETIIVLEAKEKFYITENVPNITQLPVSRRYKQYFVETEESLRYGVKSFKRISKMYLDKRSLLDDINNILDNFYHPEDRGL